MSVCLIGLGSNQGDRQAALDAATARLADHPLINVLARSTWHATIPIGGPQGQGNFLNGAVRLETSLPPHELLAFLQRIENDLGRQRLERWGPRTVDLDLLLYDNLAIQTPSLVVPHPRLALRRFVLEPAAEVAGSMLHPKIGWTIARLLEHINTSPRYLAIAGSIGAGKTRLAERLAAAIGGRLITEQPDWRQLDVFYADTARNAWQTEREFLQHRARLLGPPVESPSDSWLVSDWWFEQSAAFARVWLSADDLPSFLEQHQRLLPTVLRPRLIVLLTASPDVLSARVAQRGRTCERRLTADQLGCIQQSVIEQSQRPDVGPLLQLDSDDPDAAFTEALAAAQGME